MGNPAGPKPQTLLSMLPPLKYLVFKIPLHEFYTGKEGVIYKMKKIVKFNKKRTARGKSNYGKWVIQIIIFTFFVSAAFSFISEVLLRNVEVLVAFIILVIIITVGIVSDIVGVAVTAADETPFHSMSSRKLIGAKTSVILIRNANKISNLCSDAIGDICGIISGAAGAVIITRIAFIGSQNDRTLLAIVLSSIIASFTVGGKAIAKKFAIAECNNIVYRISYLIEKLKFYKKQD